LNEKIQRLIKLLRAADPLRRKQAEVFLRRMGASAIPEIVAELEDDDWRMRWGCCWALGVVGPGAAPAIPALITRLDDESEWVRRFAAEALGKIGVRAQDAVSPLGTVLANDPVPSVRFAAEEALASILYGDLEDDRGVMDTRG